MRALVLAFTLGLAGCATTGVRVVNVCLPMIEYSAADQSAAADELDAMADGSVVAKFVIDYGAMRAANRACLAGR